jgi:hypothetical protein
MHTHGQQRDLIRLLYFFKIREQATNRVGLSDHVPECVSVYPPIVARQLLGRNVTAVTNTHATIEELLEVSFSMWPVSYQGKYAKSTSLE